MVAMSNINKLFQKIDSFYHVALADYKLSKIAASSTWTMDDDEEEAPNTEKTPNNNELITRVQTLAKIIKDPAIVGEALLIADMYSKALHIKDGFNAVKKAVSNALNLIDLDDPDDDENPANQMVDALGEIGDDASEQAKIAGGGINKGDSTEAVKAIKEVQEQFEQKDLDKTRSGNQENIWDENAKGVFDMTGGVGLEQAGQGFGKGYSVGGRQYKDWIKSCKTEIKRYSEELVDEKNPRIKEKKTAIIDLLNKLKSLFAAKESIDVTTDTTLDNKGREVITEHAENPEDEEKLNLIERKISEIKKLITANKVGIRGDMLNRQSDELLKEYQAEKRPKEKLILQNKLLLLKTMRSEDKNKGAETKARKQLLAFLPGMTASELSRNIYEDLLKKIEEASAQKIPIKVWNKMQAEQIGIKMRKLKVTDELQKAREEAGLNRLRTQNIPGAREWMSMKLEGFVDNLSKAMLAERKTAKDRLVGSKNKKIKDEHKTLFKPLLDAVADATKKQDRKSMLEAVHKLRTGIKDQMYLLPEFSQFVLSVRISRPIHVFKTQLDDLRRMNVEEKQTLNEFDVAAINAIIANGEEAANRLEKIDIKQIGYGRTPSGKTLTDVSYNNPYATQINYIRNAVAYLRNLLDNKNSQVPAAAATGEEDVGPEKMDEETGEILHRNISPEGIITYKSVGD